MSKKLIKKNKKNKSNRPPLPDYIKQQVREKYGCGCIICDNIFFEYHHDPEYSKVKKHDPDFIFPLCPTHHTEIHKKIISEEFFKKKINEKLNDKNQAKFKKENENEANYIIFGNSQLEVDKNEDLCLIRIGGIPLIWVSYNALENKILLSAYLKFEEGVFAINKNELIFISNNYDIKTKNNSVELKSKLNDKILLKLNISSDNLLEITNLEYKEFKQIITVEDKIWKLIDENGIGISFNDCHLKNKIKMNNCIKVNGLKKDGLIYNTHNKNIGYYVSSPNVFKLRQNYSYIVDNTNIICGKLIKNKCYDNRGNLVGHLIDSKYILSNDNNYENGYPKFIKPNYILNLKEFLFDVSETLIDSDDN